MRRCRFDTLGKSPPAPRAGAPTARGWWVSPRPVGESDILIATGGGPPTGRGHLVLPPTSGWMSGSAHRQIQPPRASSSCGWTSACGDRNVGLTHRSGAHPPPAGGGSPCTGGRGGFPHRYKPSSLLRPYIADTIKLPMLELGFCLWSPQWGGLKIGVASISLTSDDSSIITVDEDVSFFSMTHIWMIVMGLE